MNQSILFPDMQTWDSLAQAVCFTAQYQGMVIHCQISMAELQSLTGEVIEEQQAAMQAFEANRFDIEDKVEQLIAEEAYDELGRIKL